MMDGRRHSVDLPISRTLLALRRVRSLRDPSTDSMSNFSALIDNFNWETNSSNGLALELVNSCEKGDVNFHGSSGSKNPGLYAQREDGIGDLELHCNSNRSKFMKNTGENSVWFGNDGFVPMGCRSNQEVARGNRTFNERDSGDCQDDGLALTFVTPYQLEGVGSYNEPLEGSLQEERINFDLKMEKHHYRNPIRSSRGAATGDIMSRVRSPCMSTSDAPLEESRDGPFLYGNEDLDIADISYSGCGISCCWSRTPKFTEANYTSDVEDQPLLPGEVGETLLSRHRKSWKHVYGNINMYTDIPRSYVQKFRPKSFNELVGQNIVARSLLSAITNERIAPFYLFHGSRGTGKTSASRIFAAAMNCLSVDEHKPCGVCRECGLFFSGRSRDVKEVDSVRINRTSRVKSLLKIAAIPPVSSRFKVFIIDDCHLLRGETWTTFLNNLDDFSGHVVFVMITPDLDKLPRSALARSIKYQFPKIKEADIGSRLEKICQEEGLEFDQVALDFIATKSNGSLRDAEMMLEQLSLLGKRITLSLAFELIGIVSEDELLELLDLALSSDTKTTIRRAREMMRSRINPMQLISQLATLIMDIISGKCQERTSEVKRKFFGRHTTEADMQHLSHALKILSETEKQLRTSKNQATWLTVALLQLSSIGPSSLDVNDLRLLGGAIQPKDGEFCSTSSTGESVKRLVSCACDCNESHKFVMHDGKETLESIWRRVTEICQSSSFKTFLRKHGKLSSVSFKDGLAVVELVFHHSVHVAKAEKSWKLIASALQSVLGCNVEIRINLVACDSVETYSKVKKSYFSLFNCSRRMHHESPSTTCHTSDPSDNTVENCSCDYRSQISCNEYHGNEVSRTIRNSDGNALSIGTEVPCSMPPDDFVQHGLEIVSQEHGCISGHHAESAQEVDKQPNCFFRALKFHKKFRSSDSSLMICSINLPQKDMLPMSNGAHISCHNSNDYKSCSRYEVRPREEDTKVHYCWRTPTFLFRESWQLRHKSHRAHFLERVLPCV